MYTDFLGYGLKNFPVVTEEIGSWKTTELLKILKDVAHDYGCRCLRGNSFREINTMLSGGLDSSFFLALLRNIFGSKILIRSFTIGGGPNHPDIQSAKLVAKRFNTEHHIIIPNKDEITNARSTLSNPKFVAYGGKQTTDGDVAVFLLIEEMKRADVHSFIAHDGIDELLGGYWGHRAPLSTSEKIKAFENFWERLTREHLMPLVKKTNYFGIEVLLPYLNLNLIEFISHIPVDDRADRNENKKPLRKIARHFLPKEILDRPKRGLCDGLMKK